MQEHLGAAVFFVALISFEIAYWWRVRALFPHPAVPVVVRALLLVLYVQSTAVDPLVGLVQNATLGLGVGLALAVAAAFVFRPAWRLSAASLVALAGVAVEQLIFRGVFLLPTLTSPVGIVYGVVGSTITNLLWRIPGERARGIPWWRTMLFSFLFVAAYVAVTALTRSLWPALLAHAVIELSRVRRPGARADA